MGITVEGMAMNDCDLCREFQSDQSIQTQADLASLVHHVRAAVDEGALDLLGTPGGATPWAVLSGQQSWSRDVFSWPFRCAACRREFEMTIDLYHGSAGTWRSVPEDSGRPGLRVAILSIDYPTMERLPRFPMELELVRRLPGPDSPDYWLGALREPVRVVEEDIDCEVTHVVLSARRFGSPILPGARRLAVNVGFVTDPSLVADACHDFRKTAYAVIATCDVGE